MCKPCHRSRVCHHSDCFWFNELDEPTLCVACESRDKNPSCTEKRCAMACPIHTSEAERNLQLCHVCSASRLPCSQCREPTPASSMTRLRCAKEHCSLVVALCAACSGMRTGKSELTCGPCWINDGRLCLYCGRTRARTEKKFRRACKECFAARSAGGQAATASRGTPVRSRAEQDASGDEGDELPPPPPPQPPVPAASRPAPRQHEWFTCADFVGCRVCGTFYRRLIRRGLDECDGLPRGRDGRDQQRRRRRDLLLAGRNPYTGAALHQPVLHGQPRGEAPPIPRAEPAARPPAAPLRRRRRGIGEDRAAMLERDSQASNPSRV